MRSRLLHSFLFVPESRVERVPKALACGADGVIFGLEDAIAPDVEVAARDEARSLARNGVFVRVNGTDIDWCEDDVELCVAIDVRGVIVQKSEETGSIPVTWVYTGDLE